MLKALFKLVVLAIAILILLQLEYNGRKIQTYVVEYFKSLKGKKEVVYIQEEPSESKAIPSKDVQTKKLINKKTMVEKKTPVSKKTADKVKTEVKKVKIIKQKADDQPDITDEDRKELQQILE